MLSAPLHKILILLSGVLTITVILFLDYDYYWKYLPIWAKFYHTKELEDLRFSIDFHLDVILFISANENIVEIFGGIY